MSYRFKANQSIARNARRVARRQIQRGRDELADLSLDRHQAIHQVRKRLKKVRAVARLVRDGLADQYTLSNAMMRDLAKELSLIRDAEALIETVGQLRRQHPVEQDYPVFDRILNGLIRRREHLSATRQNLSALIDRTFSGLQEARDLVEHWSVGHGGFDALIGPNLKRTFKRGRKALKQLDDPLDAELFHEYRKRVKYHWYHTRLLQDIWPDLLGPWRHVLKRLAEALGDHHDLSICRQMLDGPLADWIEADDSQRLSGWIDGQRRRLASRILASGGRVYAIKPKALVGQWSGCWQQWHPG